MFEYFSDEITKYPFVHFNARIICTQNCLYRLSKRFRNLLLCRQKLDSIVRTNQVGRVLITATLARKFRAQWMDKGVEQSEETDQTCLFAYSGRTSKNLAIFVKLKRASRKLQHLVFPCRGGQIARDPENLAKYKDASACAYRSKHKKIPTESFDNCVTIHVPRWNYVTGIRTGIFRFIWDRWKFVREIFGIRLDLITRSAFIRGTDR